MKKGRVIYRMRNERLFCKLAGLLGNGEKNGSLAMGVFNIIGRSTLR